eukprot:11036505-Prorocentrum_lima.AAC.1
MATIPAGTFSTGVAIVISNDLTSNIQDVEPLNDRILRITLKGVVPYTFISAYAPTAQRSDQEKDFFYDKLTELMQQWNSKGPTFLAGDFNAR